MVHVSTQAQVCGGRLEIIKQITMIDIKCVLVFIPMLALIQSDEVIVETSQGKVAGIHVSSILQNEKYYSFMGIPYAEPPVKSLRFMAPRPHPGWEDVLQAKKEKKHCAIMNLPLIPTGKYGFCGDEDCLYLSIHTPKLPHKSAADIELMPVMVLIYNDQLRLAHNASKDFGPDFLVNKDVVVATVSYRIGSPGFLSFGDDLLPGNNGIRDIILALQWIQRDVQNFGGDPKRITLMGVGGGAGLVDILLHSPKTPKRLFHNVILHSGTSWGSDYFGGNARENAIRFSKELEIETKTSSFLLKRLADISTQKLVEADHLALHADEARAVQTNLHSFGPVIEHDHPEAILTDYPENHRLNINVPVMIGYNSKEGLLISERYVRKPQYLTFADRDFMFIIPIRKNFHFKTNNEVYFKAIEEIKEKYFEAGYVKTKYPGEFIVYAGDVFSIYPIDYTVRKYVNESSSPVFYYTFDYSGEFNIKKKELLRESMSMDGTAGATYGDDICYLFVCNKARKTYREALKDKDSEEMKVVRNMVEMWTNFAKTSNPSTKDFEWKPASKDEKDILIISEELEMKTRLHEDRIQFWDDFLAKYKELAIDGAVQDIKEEL